LPWQRDCSCVLAASVSCRNRLDAAAVGIVDGAAYRRDVGDADDGLDSPFHVGLLVTGTRVRSPEGSAVEALP
jgi:hypothetical protein